jgi:hypothetical protein
MKTKPLFSVCLGLLVTAALGLPCIAGGCPGGGCSGGSGSVMETFKGGASRLPTVTAVDGNKFTANDKVYLINGDADVTVDGKPANEDSIKVGMRVMVAAKVIDKKSNLYSVTRIIARTP